LQNINHRYQTSPEQSLSASSSVLKLRTLQRTSSVSRRYSVEKDTIQA